MVEYIPKRGDIIWLNFEPQTGREQSGNRPAVVLSHESYNRVSGLGVFCPITTSVKSYPFEVPFTSDKTTGVILADQVKSFDWKSRDAKFICKIDGETLAHVLNKIEKLIK